MYAIRSYYEDTGWLVVGGDPAPIDRCRIDSQGENGGQIGTDKHLDIDGIV